jgi:tRNA nucleotidyltransferase/poly(A) polymerase
MIDPPYMVGGAPRDQVIFGKAVVGGSNKFKISDLDITTNSSDCMRLAILFASRNNFKFRIFEDRHVTVFCDGFNLDFSSNYISKNAVDFLKSEQCTEFLCPAFPKIKEKVLEAYSRDFTINTLHQNIRTGQIIDILDRAFKDIEDKTIRTVLTPEITIVDDPRRVFRAIKFAT